MRTEQTRTYKSGGVLAAALLFVACAALTLAGDPNGNATSIRSIPVGNSLSLAAVLLGLAGKGKGR